MLKSIIIADDHPLFRSALRQAVERVFPEHCIVEVNSLQEAVDALDEHDPSLLSLDLHMEDSHGFAGLVSIRSRWPALPIAVVSASESDDVIKRALDFGASGFIPKSSDLGGICEALETMYAGDIFIPAGYRDPETSNHKDFSDKVRELTPAQVRVLVGVAEGKLNKQIAYEFNISEATVKAHLTAIFRKLEVFTRTQAVLAAQSMLIDQDAVADS